MLEVLQFNKIFLLILTPLGIDIYTIIFLFISIVTTNHASDPL